MPEGRKIFFSALDWGLGHATRSVPLIRMLEAKNEVTLGVTPLTSAIWDKEFPHLKKIELPAYNIRYSRILPLWLKLLLDSPRIFRVINSEHRTLERLMDEYKFDLIISDNRFGLHTKKARTIFITHQLFIHSPVFNKTAQAVNKKFILRFDEVWVPDHENMKDSLSGDLSHGEHFHPIVQYIGPISRLTRRESKQLRFTDVMIVSGPQPKRQELEKLFIRYASHNGGNQFALISPDIATNLPSNMTLYHDPSAETISELISNNSRVWCRSGYSTLMDLHACEVKKTVLIPTPGQTEQEYLAEFWKINHGAEVIPESELSRQLN